MQGTAISTAMEGTWLTPGRPQGRFVAVPSGTAGPRQCRLQAISDLNGERLVMDESAPA